MRHRALKKPKPLRFRRISRKHLRMISLRYAKIKIPMKLLPVIIIMGVIHTGPRHIGYAVIRVHRLCRIKHILVKYSPVDKSPESVENLPLIGRAYVGAEKVLIPSSGRSAFVLMKDSSG